MHAAGVGFRSLLLEIESRQLRYVYAPKAVGVQHVHGTTQCAAVDAWALFSSGAALGFKRQGSYAAANRCLDALALSRRSQGVAASCQQWPGVSGAGVGVDWLAAIASLATNQISMAKGIAGISLDEYAACLCE